MFDALCASKSPVSAGGVCSSLILSVSAGTLCSAGLSKQICTMQIQPMTDVGTAASRPD